ncbi:polyprenyl synthetase family protein [Robiginitomaculum antarcticum]|uniref:polyprenyl synthetase family protein n=1 Tax=Robiginitomaculum antarcticum TaxID=437507 RepID=UPI00038261A2|nr:farnesyl diphosphate synthase [Robiginitomaculum antarcticum]
MSDFKFEITEFARRFEGRFDGYLPRSEGLNARIAAAMRYTALGGGKRLRPYFVITVAKMLGYDDEPAWRVAAALECVHVYSLVHDDLPCMDNDDVRRGKPTVHRQWDEATAVLTGDALLTHAFELMCTPMDGVDPVLQLALSAELAMRSGEAGMIGGQMIDLSMDELDQTEKTITTLQDLKTGALIHYAISAGARLGGASKAQYNALSRYARRVGLLFQITDDLLDVEGNAHVMGKAAGKDNDHGKATFVTILGLDGAKARAREISKAAIADMDIFGANADPLRHAVQFVLERRA